MTAYIKVPKIFKKNCVINSANPIKTKHSYLCLFRFIPFRKVLSVVLCMGWYC